MKKEYHTLKIPQLGECKPVCVRQYPPELKEQDFQALQILHCKYEQVSYTIKHVYMYLKMKLLIQSTPLCNDQVCHRVIL